MHQETLTYQADGLQWLNEQGAAILAHENTHKHLLAAQRVEDWEYNFPPPPLAAVPTEVFSSEKTVGLDRSTLRLKPYGPAHTDIPIGTASIHSSTTRPGGALTG
jgi:hypothetical protein